MVEPEGNRKAPKPAKQPRPRSSVGVLVVAWLSFVIGLFTLGVVVVAAAIGWELYVEHKLEQHRVRTERARDEPVSVHIENRCSATAGGFSCAFSNTNNENALPVCVHGVVTHKTNGMTLKSMAACSGVMERRSTRDVHVEWIGGSPDEICYRESYGNRTLDWSKCDFTVDAPR